MIEQELNKFIPYILKEVLTPQGKLILYGISTLPNFQGVYLIFYPTNIQQIYFSIDCKILM